jgi:hypothetical protein
MLIAAGDSIIFGSELSDEHLTPSNLTFPALVAKQKRLDYHCLAQPGISNSSICKSVISYLEKQSAELVIVCWTFSNRQEFHLDGKWVNLNGWSHNPDNQFNKDIVEFSKTYFSIAYSDDYEKYVTLKEILLLQNYLKVKNQPYVFTANSKFDFDNLDTELQPYLSAIDRTQWMWFEGQGFYDWAKYRKFPVGIEGHPLEQAHKEASKFFLPG